MWLASSGRRATLARPRARLARIFEKALAGAGFRVAMVDDGEQALEAFRAGSPDVLVSDISLATLDGFELLAAVRRLTSALPGQAGVEIDRGMLAVLRPVFRVLYDPVDPFHPDPGFAVGLLPGLAPVTILADEDPSSDRYLFAETTLVRERNRLMEALSLALFEAERLLSRVEGGS